MKVKIRSCARCHGNHEGIEFAEFNTPVYESEDLVWTHWAMCPTNDEPILLIVEAK